MGGERKRRTCAPQLGNQLCPAGSGSFLRLTHRTVPCGEGGSPFPSILPHSPVSPSLLTKSVRSALGSSGQNMNCSQVLRGNFFFFPKILGSTNVTLKERTRRLANKLQVYWAKYVRKGISLE